MLYPEAPETFFQLSATEVMPAVAFSPVTVASFVEAADAVIVLFAAKFTEAGTENEESSKTRAKIKLTVLFEMFFFMKSPPYMV